MGIAHKILPHYTYSDIQLWNDRFELYDGFPVAMRPSPVPRHQVVAASLKGEFYLALKKCKACKVYDPLDYKIKEDIVLIPDMLVVCGKIKKKFLDFPPILVSEILSPSTALRDKNTKFEIYKSQGIKYYLLVDPEKNKVEIYVLKDNVYVFQELKDNKYTFQLDVDCKAIINFKEVF
jgi:Uma2 family endonuclease